MNRILLVSAALAASCAAALAETVPADSLVIDKRTMTLTVWRGGSAEALYGVATGRHPENHQIFFYTGLKTDLNSKQKLIVGNIKPSSELPAYLSEI